MPAGGCSYSAGYRTTGRNPAGKRAAPHRPLRPRLRSLAMAHVITAADIIPAEEYATRRKELRAAVVALKRQRRLHVGPAATLHFENFETMRMQIQEMLHVERGGAEQLPGELVAYNPLVPNGRELVATVLFEIDDPVPRAAFLAKGGGIEQTAFIEGAGSRVSGGAETD